MPRLSRYHMLVNRLNGRGKRIAQHDSLITKRKRSKRDLLRGAGIWHTEDEHAIVKQLGGKPHHPGYDGISPEGKPFEVREAKKSGLYRLQEDVHKELLKGQGFYVFKKGETLKEISAKDVDKMLKPGKWYTDRTYPYKFLKESEVFPTKGV